MGRLSAKIMFFIVVKVTRTSGGLSLAHKTGRVRQKGGERKGQKRDHENQLASTEMPQEREISTLEIPT